MTTLTKQDYNSITNQQIKGMLVGREVVQCASYLVDELLKASNYVYSKDVDLPTFEDIENMYSYPECIGEYADFAGGGYKDLQDEISRLESLKDETDNTEIADGIQSDIDSLNDLEQEPAEIFEWWIVTDWLAEKLRGKGECILEYANMVFWGRQTTGQAILLDYVISKICEDMQILEGMENEWKTR